MRVVPSQSLRKSGQFLFLFHAGYLPEGGSRNPFVNQVSFFLVDVGWTSSPYGRSQSLRKSGQFLFDNAVGKGGKWVTRRNPFVNQVSFFRTCLNSIGSPPMVAIPS